MASEYILKQIDGKWKLFSGGEHVIRSEETKDEGLKEGKKIARNQEAVLKVVRDTDGRVLDSFNYTE